MEGAGVFVQMHPDRSLTMPRLIKRWDLSELQVSTEVFGQESRRVRLK